MPSYGLDPTVINNKSEPSNRGHLLAIAVSFVWAITMTVLYATAAGKVSSPAPLASNSINSMDHVTQDFAFVASYINSTRQYGKCLNFIVKYRYIGDQYFDYKPLRETLMYYSEPTPELPMAVYWEIVNKAFVKNITSRYSLEGISSQIQVCAHHMSF